MRCGGIWGSMATTGVRICVRRQSGVKETKTCMPATGFLFAVSFSKIKWFRYPQIRHA